MLAQKCRSEAVKPSTGIAPPGAALGSSRDQGYGRRSEHGSVSALGTLHPLPFKCRTLLRPSKGRFEQGIVQSAEEGFQLIQFPRSV